MNFYGLRSIVASQKVAFDMRAPSESFRIAEARQQPYVEPTFSKVEFETERPQVLLISAVGATGKSALAQVLSNISNRPLLDLAKHKPVGDNTLTGLLTGAFHVHDLSGVFQGLASGTYGVIIDGIDEARSKTTEKAFEAFLDDVIRLCATAKTTTFVLLGRTQILEDCWLYLTTHGLTVGLITISPFDIDSARKYIDAFTGIDGTQARTQYAEVRDGILSRLSAAFAGGGTSDTSFLSFIGYPPVLDAIVALLSEEHNYYRLKGELESEDLNDVEIGLIYRVISYVLNREREQKVIPNIVRPLIVGLPAAEQKAIQTTAFGAEEQSLRLVWHCLAINGSIETIPEAVLNEQYEAQLAGWLPEHPFLTGREFRSAIFEAAALATLLASNKQPMIDAAIAYADSHKSNYHLVYLLRHIASDGAVPVECLHVLLGSALEFRSTTSSVELHVEGSRADALQAVEFDNVVETQIDVIAGSAQDESSKTFRFHSTIDPEQNVRFGPRLSASYIALPCDVSLVASQELELTAPIEIAARRIYVQAPAVVLRHHAGEASDNHVVLEGDRVESSASSIITNGVDLTVAVADSAGIAYPLIQHVEKRAAVPTDPALKEKFLRLKRMLVHFRSHSKGALAKYRYKIEHARVLGNESGPAILDQLRKDGILTLSGSMYFLDPAQVDRHLGISWDALRRGQTSEKLLQYLRAIS
jgi:hypothetical protein